VKEDESKPKTDIDVIVFTGFSEKVIFHALIIEYNTSTLIDKKV